MFRGMCCHYLQDRRQDGGSKFLQYLGNHLGHYTGSQLNDCSLNSIILDHMHLNIHDNIYRTTIIAKSYIFWDITPCSPLKVTDVSEGLRIPPKRHLTFSGLHGVTFQKIELLITTSVITSNPTHWHWFHRCVQPVGQNLWLITIRCALQERYSAEF
jgi:hypothetical protein